MYLRFILPTIPLTVASFQHLGSARECKGCMSFNRGVNEFNRGVNELNRGVNRSVARQGCNLLRAAVTSAVTSQGCCCGNLQIHPLDLGHSQKATSGSM